MQGFAKLNDTEGGKKDGDSALDQQENQKMLGLEKECINEVKKQEQIASEEDKEMRSSEITLEKSLHDKARDKFKIA